MCDCITGSLAIKLFNNARENNISLWECKQICFTDARRDTVAWNLNLKTRRRFYERRTMFEVSKNGRVRHENKLGGVNGTGMSPLLHRTGAEVYTGPVGAPATTVFRNRRN